MTHRVNEIVHRLCQKSKGRRSEFHMATVTKRHRAPTRQNAHYQKYDKIKIEGKKLLIFTEVYIMQKFVINVLLAK